MYGKQFSHIVRALKILMAGHLCIYIPDIVYQIASASIHVAQVFRSDSANRQVSFLPTVT